MGPATLAEGNDVAGRNVPDLAVAIGDDGFTFQNIGGLVAGVVPLEPAGRAIPQVNPGPAVGQTRQRRIARLRASFENPVGMDRRRREFTLGFF